MGRSVGMPLAGEGSGLSRLCRCSLLLSDQEHQVGPEAAEQASRPGFVARPVVHKLPAVRSPESAIKGRETYQAAVEHRRRDLGEVYAVFVRKT